MAGNTISHGAMAGPSQGTGRQGTHQNQDKAATTATTGGAVVVVKEAVVSRAVVDFHGG